MTTLFSNGNKLSGRNVLITTPGGFSLGLPSQEEFSQPALRDSLYVTNAFVSANEKGAQLDIPAASGSTLSGRFAGSVLQVNAIAAGTKTLPRGVAKFSQMLQR